MSENPPSEVQRTDEERVYVLSRLAENSERGEAGILITDLAAGVWKRRWIIAAVTVFGGVVGLGLERMSPTLYRATATILIQPPQFSSELKPKALSIGAYSALLNADYTTSQVRKILVDEGVLPPGVNLGWLKSRVTTTIPSSGAGRQQMSLPLIEITASAGKPEMAATIANAYASVFARMSREIASRGQEGALQLIASQYPTSLKRLTVAAEEFKNRHDGYARRKEELNQKWNMRLSDFQAETVRLVAQFEKGTHQLTLEFAETHNPSLLEGQLARIMQEP